MTDTATIDAAAAPASAPGRVRKVYPLRDIAVAPENLRFAEPPDEDIPQLAATIRAAGLLQPLTVRPGRRKEKPAMALDGRRRLLALERLRAEGAIGDDYPVEVYEETDPARQAAAAVLTNSAVPVHVADVIAAIGRMLTAKLAPEAIARALGYGEVEVRRLAALAALHPRALEALKLGRINLRQARLLARLPDRALQRELAESALAGRGFAEWRVSEQLDRGAVTTFDRRFALVGPDRYAAGGGRTEADLFGERAAVLLDPEILQAQWEARARALAAGLEAEGLELRLCAGPAREWPEGLEPVGADYGAGLDEAQVAAWREAQASAQAAAAQLAGADVAADTAEASLRDWLAASLAAARAGAPGRPVTVALLRPDPAVGLAATFYGPPVPAGDADEEPEPKDAIGMAATPSCGAAAKGDAEAPAPGGPPGGTAGIGHALHEVRTDLATRVLIRALADDPAAALVALTARLFCVLVLRSGLGRGGGALSVSAEAYSRPRAPAVDALDGEVRRRLAERRAAFEGAGASPIAWVASLPEAARQGLLAELVALSLDLREERTHAVRATARAEAAEIAELCAADAARWWTPDAAFLQAHAKPHLLDMLEAMGAGDPRAGALRKDELVARVAACAAERRWAPAWLSWRAPPQVPPAEAGPGPHGAGEAEPAAA
ncbi:ParB N-terminal domain-containing protein [Phenylobacterium terrae]|uniref:ParB N-terminal domain-containing protein n=1 Tax=Phenylobacterium terrae TaxID=2665495 RepID=A0ABW4N5V5_9CAUL